MIPKTSMEELIFEKDKYKQYCCNKNKSLKVKIE